MPAGRRRRKRPGLLTRIRVRWAAYLDEMQSKGRLEAHQAAAYRNSARLERLLERSRRRRRGLLAWLSAGRRRFLDALIGSLERELDARRRGGGTRA